MLTQQKIADSVQVSSDSPIICQISIVKNYANEVGRNVTTKGGNVTQKRG